MGLAAWQTDVTQKGRATFTMECWEFFTLVPCSREDGLDDKRRHKYRLYMYIGIEFMLDKERNVWVYMCLGRMSVEWVGLVHLQNTQDSHIQSTCYCSV